MISDFLGVRVLYNFNTKMVTPARNNIYNFTPYPHLTKISIEFFLNLLAFSSFFGLNFQSCERAYWSMPSYATELLKHVISRRHFWVGVTRNNYG